MKLVISTFPCPRAENEEPGIQPDLVWRRNVDEVCRMYSRKLQLLQANRAKYVGYSL